MSCLPASISQNAPLPVQAPPPLHRRRSSPSISARPRHTRHHRWREAWWDRHAWRYHWRHRKIAHCCTCRHTLLKGIEPFKKRFQFRKPLISLKPKKQRLNFRSLHIIPLKLVTFITQSIYHVLLTCNEVRIVIVCKDCLVKFLLQRPDLLTPLLFNL